MIRVEKLTYPDRDVYRFSISMGGSLREEIITCDIDSMESQLQRYENRKDALVHTGHMGIAALVDKIKSQMESDMEAIFRRTGGLDNSLEYNRQASATTTIAAERAAWQWENQQIAVRQLEVNPSINILPGQMFTEEPIRANLARAREVRSQVWGEEGQSGPEKKAMKLLRSQIGDEKYKQLITQGFFDRKGKYGIYEFHLDDASGVRLIQEHKIGDKTRVLKWTLCIQSQVADMPKGDVILSRYLELKNDEDKFVQTANFRQVKTVDEATATIGVSA